MREEEEAEEERDEAPAQNSTAPDAEEEQQQEEEPTHYETLRVSTFASDGEIRRAYLKLALQCHPDKFVKKGGGGEKKKKKKNKSGSEGSNDRESEDETEEARKKQSLLFQRVSEAYGVLSDPELRRRYDSEGHAFFSASRTSSNHTSEEKEYEHYLRRFRELVVLTPQGLDLEF